jgi:hypothetical protein
VSLDCVEALIPTPSTSLTCTYTFRCWYLYSISHLLVLSMAGPEDKRRPAALNLTAARPGTSESSSSDGSLKPRTPRFAEATSVHSPVEARSPFADPEKSHVAQPQPADIGFGYIAQRESIPVPMTPRTPLKSAMKVPGTPAHLRNNPLSPTFREEDILEKRELSTEKEQARDVVCELLYFISFA